MSDAHAGPVATSRAATPRRSARRTAQLRHVMVSPFAPLAVLAGATLPLQAAINARLARQLGSPIWAAAVSGLVVTASLAVVASAVTRGGPRLAGAAALPWWAWTGGLCGAIVLSATTATAPRLGTANMVALVMAGQVACSLLLDGGAMLGLPFHPLTPRRALAALLLLAGAAVLR